MSQFQLKDAKFIETKALSNGAGSVNSDGFDLGQMTARGARLPEVEGKITAPALTTTQLPDSETMTYKVEHADQSNYGDAVTLYDAVLVQTGASGEGAAAASARYRIPSDCKRYVRIVATKTGTGDCSTVSLTHELVF